MSFPRQVPFNVCVCPATATRQINIVITATLLFILYMLIYNIKLMWHDPIMQMKHWVILMSFEIVIQILIEREFRKKL